MIRDLVRYRPLIRNLILKELGDFMDAPVKTFSSRMAMRLGFAVATHLVEGRIVAEGAPEEVAARYCRGGVTAEPAHAF
jgi:hypothetical protein